MRLEYSDGVNWVKVPNSQDIVYSNVPRGILVQQAQYTFFTLNANTPQKLLLTTNASFLYDFTVNQALNNRLIYTGRDTVSVLVNLQIALNFETTSVTNLKTNLFLYKNNTVIPSGNTIINIPQSLSETQMSTQAFVAMSTNDYVEAWMAVNKTAELKISSFTMTVLGCGTSI
jgi:hypothetical protein